jgi:hypothetical protein
MKRLVTLIATIGLTFAGSAAFAADPACDYNGDGACDGADLDVVMGAQGTVSGDDGYVAAADHDGDGVISLVDAAIFAQLRDS